MSIALSVHECLENEGIDYAVVLHSPTRNAAHTAQAAHVPGDWLAKSVILEDDNGYVMAVLPASHKLDLHAISRELHRDELTLASERALTGLFGDCALGAVPPLGRAYQLETVLDRSLAGAPEVYFEAGDHVSLIHVSGADFQRLLGDVPQRSISHHL